MSGLRAHFAPVVSDSLAYLAVARDLRDWLQRLPSIERLAEANARLAASSPDINGVLAAYSDEKHQAKAAYTHDAEIGRLGYRVWLPGASEPITDVEAVKAVLRRSRRSLLWRIANQAAFFHATEALFMQVRGALNTPLPSQTQLRRVTVLAHAPRIDANPCLRVSRCVRLVRS